MNKKIFSILANLYGEGFKYGARYVIDVIEKESSEWKNGDRAKEFIDSQVKAYTDKIGTFISNDDFNELYKILLASPPLSGLHKAIENQRRKK